MSESLKHTPDEVYETIDGTPLQGTLREVHPKLFQGVPLEDVMKSPTALGEALRRTFAKVEQGMTSRDAITAVAATRKPASGK